MAYGILVREVMTHRPTVISEDKTVMDAIRKMLKEGVGSIVVVDSSKNLRGIFTEKDVLLKIVSKSLDPKKIPIKKVMTTKLYTIDPWLDLENAAEIMNKRNVRRLPVVEGTKLVGMITIKDMLRTEPQIIDVLKEKLMVREPETKPIFDERRYESGVCEVCSNYSDKLQYSEGMWLCESCLEETT
jgi:CBS domain-containing protein